MARHTHDVESLAKEAAGNWQRFESFGWNRAYDLDDAQNWCIVYTHNRDSGLLEQSNADCIKSIMQPYLDADTEDPDVMSEDHNHWGCGWVAGYAIRVYNTSGEVTPAFKAWCEIQESLEDYPILNEDDYSRREYEATLENIESEGRGLDDEYQLPESWASEVFSWFWEHNQRAVENRDDQGGCPTKDELREAFDGLGYLCFAEHDAKLRAAFESQCITDYCYHHGCEPHMVDVTWRETSYGEPTRCRLSLDEHYGRSMGCDEWFYYS